MAIFLPRENTAASVSKRLRPHRALAFLHALDPEGAGGVAPTERHMRSACFDGDRAAVKWLANDLGLPLTPRCCFYSAWGLSDIRVLHIKTEAPPPAAAAEARSPWLNHRSLSCLEWILASGCRGNAGACAEAASKGRLDALKLLRDYGCPWDWSTCAEAAMGGHLAVVKWARHKQCPWNHSVAAAAASGGHLDVLRWAMENGCPSSYDALGEACRGAHLPVMKFFADDLGWPMSRTLFAYAASGGSVDALEWLRDRGCPWGPSACASAAGGGHVQAIAWLRARGCPWDETTLQSARGRGPRMMEWLRANGYPGLSIKSSV
jgi:hypothetical protein